MGWLLLVLLGAEPVGEPAEGAASPDARAPESVEHGSDEAEGPGGALAEEPSGEGALGEAPEGAGPPPGGTRAPPRQVPERWTVPPEVAAAVRAVADRPVGVRMEAASRSFLGLPYVNDAAGEGDDADPDPPSRYDAFDCLTFVEEVLALALAGDPLDAPAIRDALRYQGAPAYQNRRHFMEAEWVPAAIRNGLLEDVTGRIGQARLLEKEVTARTWAGWGRRTRLFGRIPDERLPVGTWTLPFLDLDEAERVARDIPAGAILLTVRTPRDGVPIAVTHISAVVPLEDGSLRMRHATRMGVRSVRDDYVEWYVRHLRDYVNWPSLGVSILLPREQGPRRSALGAP